MTDVVIFLFLTPLILMLWAAAYGIIKLVLSDS